MALTHVQLLSVPVSDQDRARDFYVNVLGFDLVRDAEMQPGLSLGPGHPPGGQTSLTLVTWFDSMPAGALRGLVLRPTTSTVTWRRSPHGAPSSLAGSRTGHGGATSP